MLIEGTNSNETLTGTKGDDQISSLGGNDTINATQGTDTIDGGIGTDRLTIITGNLDRFDAYAGPRTYTLTSSSATDSAGLLNSSLTGIERLTIDTRGTGNYDDTIDASAFVAPATGAFVLFVTFGDGDNVVIGTSQNDFITTGSGDDQVSSGAGNDTVVLNAGSNWADLGAGFDAVQVQVDNSSGATIYITGSDGTVQTVIGGNVTNTFLNAEDVTIRNTVFNAPVTTVDASGLTGLAGTLYIDDSDGSTISIGHSGRDFFVGNSTHTLGNDVFTGNGGADIFDYTWAVNAMDGDTITDFDADDIIDLQFNNPTQNGGLLAYQFIGNAAFSGSAGQYRWEASGGQTRLLVDTNGDGAADETLTIANGEFALVETVAGSNQLVRANLVRGDDNGNLNLRGSLGRDVIYGYDLPDRLYASDGRDFLDGGGFNDRLQVNIWDTTLFSAPTGDRTYTITNTRFTDSSGLIDTTMTSMERLTFSTQGLNFNDTIDVSGWVSGAPSGIVTLLLGNGNNTVIGSQYDDFIMVGTGQNVVDGGAGIDTLQMTFDNSAGSTLYVTGSGGSIAASGSGIASQTLTSIENMSFTGANTSAGSTVDASALTGFAGQLGFGDTNGTNIFIGHAGRDFFSNGHGYTLGNDVYTGNGGADIYDYTWAVNAMDGDTITDFDADDIIDLQFNTVTQNTAGYLANQFIGTGVFTGSAGQYRYFAQGGKTYVQVDHTGDGTADETLTIANGQFALGETAPGSNQLKIIGMSGTSASDTLYTTLGNDTLYGQGGNDLIYASNGTDFIDGGAGSGDRLVLLMFDAARFAPSTGDRHFIVTANSVTETGGAVSTSFTGIERINIYTAGSGNFNDTIDLSAFTTLPNLGVVTVLTLADGNDTVIGSNFNDEIYTGGGINIVNAGNGFDRVNTNDGFSVATTQVVTGAGNLVETSQNGTITNSITNAELVYVGASTKFPLPPDGLTHTVDASAYTGNAQLVFVDHAGDDLFIGSAKNDIFTNQFNTTVGTDTYRGNGGADVFDYTVAVNALNNDTILDFDADDTIDFRFNDGVAVPGQLLANQWIGANAFTGTAGQYRYQIDGAETRIEIDTNGDTVADRTLHIANGAFAIVETAAGSNILRMAAAGEAVEGVVADGYIAGATLFVDVDGDGVRDEGEAWTTTDANGNFALNVNQGGTLVAIDGVDTDTGFANGLKLKSPFGASVVNPLTTLIAAVMAASAMTAAQAETLVADNLGLSGDLDLLNTDLLDLAGGAAALDAQKAAVMIANLIATAEALPDADALTEAAILDALAALVLDPGSDIDLTDSAAVRDILDDALPTASGLDAVAAQLADEAGDIAAAGSLAAVKAQQLAALLTGDELANVLTGNEADNVIIGNGGNDELYGLGGNDRLDGGTGADRMEGGLGNDIYIVGDAGDQVIEAAGGGTDRVIASINYTLPDEVEILELLAGLQPLNGTGNALDNALYGNAGSNRLNGGAGDDRIHGGDGQDYLTGGAGNDRFLFDLGSASPTKQGPLTVDSILDFHMGDVIDLSAIDANSLSALTNDAFTFRSGPSKEAGTLWTKSYDSVNGAEKALGVDLDGVNGTSPYHGPVTVLFGNHNGGAADFAVALIGVGAVNPGDIAL